MNRNIYVPLPREAFDALRQLAEREWRPPKQQAAVLILDGLERAGIVPGEHASAGKARR